MLVNEHWIDELIESFLGTIAGMDLPALQPIDCFSIHPLYAKEWVSFIHRIISNCAKENIPIKELATLFPNPSALSVQLFFLANDLKVARTPKSERLKLTRFFYGILKKQRIEDPFVLHKKNLLYSDAIIKTKLEKVTLLSADEYSARLLARIYLGGSHLAYALYADNYPDFGIENHGPYDVSKQFGANCTLVIKELLNLKPTELFRAAENVQTNNIQIYSVYENLTTKIETASCHYSYDGNPITALRFWALLADGKPVTKKEDLIDLEQNLSENSVNQWKYLTKLPKEALKQKMLEQRCYLFKKICERIGIPWKPSKKMIVAVQGKPFKQGLYKILNNKGEERVYWAKILDPRIDFFP